MKELKFGIVGACGRGASFKTACETLEFVRIHAVCDINREALPQAAERLGADEQYTDYETMLRDSNLDAVIIGTPMPCHAPQAVAALKRGLHVLSEVPAGVSVEECQELVRTCSAGKVIYMMAENYTYMKPNVLVREIVGRGLFGVPYYAEGEYLHELKQLNEITRWRRRWQTGVNGVTYGTHSLGPILQWMAGDRVVSVCCAGSGHHYKDPRGSEYENEDSTVMLCKMRSGGLVKIRLDMLSDRPHAMTNYQLQGTDGSYESARGAEARNWIWLRAKCKNPNQWMNLGELEEEFLPEMWRKGADIAAKAGHGGGDYFEVLDFVNAILGKCPPPIGIHEAMDMTLPGLVSQKSIVEGGRWLPVPDSRTWMGEGPKSQLQMIWPERRLARAVKPRVPKGYLLRQYREEDETGYLDLMAKAGFTDWNQARIRQVCQNVAPDGFFVMEHGGSGKIVASAMALHQSREHHPFGGELGWVAGDPDHKGKGLGMAVVAAATKRLIEAGYRNVYLLTDDFRLPAISVYLELGYEPFLCAEGMAARWKEVRGRLAEGKNRT